MELERERLAAQQGANLADPIPEDDVRQRLERAERDVQVGQAVEQEVRRQAGDDRRQAAQRSWIVTGKHHLLV